MKAYIITMIILQAIGAVVQVFEASQGKSVCVNITSVIVGLGFVTWGFLLLQDLS